MAKSIRSKVKKRLRTVKRGVIKSELTKPTSKLGVRETQKSAKLQEAMSGYIKPGTHAHSPSPPIVRPKAHTRPPTLPLSGVRIKNAFRYDDADAVIPQHDWKQGPDYRNDRVEDGGYAMVGSNRPKVLHQGPSQIPAMTEKEIMSGGYEMEPAKPSRKSAKKGHGQIGGPGHEHGLGGRPRKESRQKKKSGVTQGYGKW